MRKIFRVCISNSNDCEELDLPASDYELLDMAERLRLEPGRKAELEILRYPDSFSYLEKCIPAIPDIHQLNALAGRLNEIDETDTWAMAVFEGLIGMKMQKGELPIPIHALIDFAYSADCCHVVEDVDTDYKLGRFLAENGFLPEAQELAGTAFELLDFVQIGKTHREAENSVITSFGYVEQHSEVHPVSKNMDFLPRQPDYAILLEVSKGFFNDPGYDSGKSVQLKLPASQETLDAVLETVETWDWREVGWSCLDCCAPALADMISDGEEGIDFLNQMAQRLADLEPNALTAYKALLEAMECKNLHGAEALIGSLDEYIFSPQHSSPVDVANGELSLILCAPDAATLAPHLNLYQYGQALIKKCGGVLTPYGLIEPRGPHMSPAERVMWGAEEQGSERSFRLLAETEVNELCDDAGQPVQGMEESPQQGGMEMM